MKKLSLIITTALIGFLALITGCNGNPTPDVTVLPGVENRTTSIIQNSDTPATLTKLPTFIEALRESCLKYQQFTLVYEGEEEHYECKQRN